MKHPYKSLLFALIFLSTEISAQDGLPDLSFNSTGTKLVNFGQYTNFQDVAVQPDGKIVAVGSASNNNDFDFLVARFNDDGSADNSFGSSGKTMLNLGSTFDQAISLALQPDGKIVAGGKMVGSGAEFNYVLTRFKPNGTLDSTFGVNGISIIDFNGNNDEATKMVLQPDGKIVMVGSTSNQVSGSIGLIRYLSNGLPDSTFNGTGRVETTLIADALSGNDVALQADGKIVVAGSKFTNGFTTFTLVRYRTNGLIDSSFATYGMTELPILGGSSTAASVAIQPDGKIVATGAWLDTANNSIVARYTETGALDGNFGNNGRVLLNLGAMDNARSIMVLPDSKLIIASTADNVCKVVKLDNTGDFETSFNSTGIASTNFSNMNEYFYAVALDTASKIIAVGTAGMDANMARYTNTVQQLPNAITAVQPSVSISLYPNPVRTVLQIAANGEQVKEVNIYALSGQLLISDKSVGNEISMEQLHPGIYLVEVVTSTHIHRGKISKID